MGLELLQLKLRDLLLSTPNRNIFPQEPWDEKDMEDIEAIIQDFVDQIEDPNPWKDWLDRWKFYKEENLKGLRRFRNQARPGFGPSGNEAVNRPLCFSKDEP